MFGSRKILELSFVIAAISWAFMVPASAIDLGELDCVIEPHMVIDVASRVDGIVESISVERGDLVEADQVLVELDSGVEKVAVAAARSRATANAEVTANRVSVEFAQRRRGRLEALFLDKAVSRDQMDEVSTETDLTRLQLQQAEENRRIAELELRQSLEVLKRHTIRSPIDGVVVQRYLAPGESTEDQPILRIAQIDPLRVEVIVPVAAFGLIETGQNAIVSPEAPKEGNFPATVTIVDRVADAASGTYRVRLSMPNPDYELPSGLKCSVRFMPKSSLPDAQVAEVRSESSEAASVDGRSTAPVARLTADRVAQQCRTVGPFANEAAADRVSEALSGRAGSVKKHARQRDTDAGFAVLSERQPSVSQARALAERMRAAGIVDLHVFSDGASAGFVSLGVYNDERNASQRQQALKESGFRTVLRNRTTRESEYWLDVELAPDSGSIVLASDTVLDGASIATVPCKELYAARD